MVFLSLMAATLVSEDLACVAAGLMIHSGHIGIVEGVTACTLGIFVGDLGLWVTGRVGAKIGSRWNSSSRLVKGRASDWFNRLPQEELRRWLAQNAAVAIVVSRVLPGTRLPMHVCAGLFGVPLRVYGLWTFVAVLLWTPVLVLTTAAIGNAAEHPLSSNAGGSRWISQLSVAAVVLLTLRAFRPYVVSAFSNHPVAKRTSSCGRTTL